jgi:hypothetical protein
MKRSNLEHIIGAAGAIVGDDELVVIGSQAILGQFPDAPLFFLRSMEADVFPRNRPELSDVIDGAIGEGSAFHESFGYYAQGVGAETATLPGGWLDRLVRIENANTNGVAGLCLEVHDLAISKYVAGRPKDLEFNRELAKRGMLEKQALLDRLRATQLSIASRDMVSARIDRDFPTRKQGRGSLERKARAKRRSRS